MWRYLVNHPDYTEGDLCDYYQRWVTFSKQEIANLLKLRRFGIIPRVPALIHVSSVVNAFDHIIP